MSYPRSTSRLVIWGAAGHAKVVREALGARAQDVCAVFDLEDVAPPFDDVPLYTGDRALSAWLTEAPDPSQVGFIIAIGGARGAERIDLHEKLIGAGLTPESIVHRTAFVAIGATCAPGSQVLAMAAVCEGAEVGTQSIINTAATLDHETRVGKGVHIGPGAHVAGLVEIEDFAFVGAGAVVLPRLRIGTGATVGAGAVGLRDVPAGAIVAGNPAKELRIQP